MQTATHAYWTWRLARDRPRGGWIVLGAVAPDLPALAVGAGLSARGVDRGELLDEIYHRPAWRWLHLAAHALLAPVAVLAAGRRRPGARALAGGWLGHLSIDYLTHHTDAWPPLWPLQRRGWPSPISYWETAHHARLWSTGEAGALALATAVDRRRTGRVLGVAACALAAGPALLKPEHNLWTALGYRP